MQALSFLNPLFNDCGKKLKFIARIILIVGLVLTLVFTIINFVQAGIAGGDGPSSSGAMQSEQSAKNYARDMAHFSYLQAQGTGHFIFCGFLTLIFGTCGTAIAALAIHALGGIAEKHVENDPVVTRPAPAYNVPQYGAPQQQTGAQAFCDGCGAPIEPGSAFCGVCGKKQD